MNKPKLNQNQLEFVLMSLEAELEQLHKQQCQKAKKIAHSIRPDLTDEDLLNPDNFKEVVGNPDFMYEDGIAAGILSAKIAVRSWLKAICTGL